MLEQHRLIERVREVCRADPRLISALMYGSFAAGEGDHFSDIEFLLYFNDDVLPEVDQREWVERVAPVALYFTNEFGVGTAIFHHLIRGEFHFDRQSDVHWIDVSWRETDFFPSVDRAVILDRTGELRRRIEAIAGAPIERREPERIDQLIHQLVNWVLFGWTVLERGEYARAHDLLGHVHRHLLWLARIAEHQTTHWATPSRRVERDLSAAAMSRFVVCTAPLDRPSLLRAYREAWQWGNEMMATLVPDERFPPSLVAAIDRRLDADDRSFGRE